MTEDFSYDPVTALDESSATGAAADIFSDIRKTMGIPLVTSIWRGLAGMDDNLQRVWNAASSIYTSGHAERALERVINQTRLPAPHALAPTQLACVGIDDVQLKSIRTIIEAYNRSNGLNMVALAGLIAPPSEDRGKACPRTLPVWSALPSLPMREAIDANTWDLILHINAMGASGIDAHVATLWRHLGRWPSLLSVLYAAFLPAHADGSIARAANQMVELTRREGLHLAQWRNENIALSDQARQTISGYVTSPTQVARMVTIGHTLADWLPHP